MLHVTRYPLQVIGFLFRGKPNPDPTGNSGNLILFKFVGKIKVWAIVSSDGDFYSLVQYLYENGKLAAVLSPDIKNCSSLLKQTAKAKMQFINELRNKLEYKKKSTT